MARPAGRPPTPPELKVLRSRTPPSKEKPPGDAPSAIPEPPDDLGEPGRRAWVLYWEHARAWLKWTDLPLVERLCRLIDDAATIRAAVLDEGLTVKNKRTRRSAVHAGYNSMLGVFKSIERLEASLGFSPVDRSRVQDRSEDADDPLARWIAGKS
jgi:P27 family predicted phage terminase small subunit